jgi:hypothetical protein
MRGLSCVAAAKVTPAAHVPMSVAGAAVQFGEFAARSSLPNGFEGSDDGLAFNSMCQSVIEPPLAWPY